MTSSERPSVKSISIKILHLHLNFTDNSFTKNVILALDFMRPSRRCTCSTIMTPKYVTGDRDPHLSRWKNSYMDWDIEYFLFQEIQMFPQNTNTIAVEASGTSYNYANNAQVLTSYVIHRAPKRCRHHTPRHGMVIQHQKCTAVSFALNGHISMVMRDRDHCQFYARRDSDAVLCIHLINT
ncbi:jg11273 [Pararge aegeria aegeria]|uniref:Jg11273 protein n=1 Tax=Pararge aegeria aegeria TaxID=348720 RepID=A0A8S4RMK8_9NEOP|nr:jg11273 [Pararge aegeria aegeria]